MNSLSESSFVLTYYKTEPCKRPPRLCRQGYACPFFHNNKDRRRSPKHFKYRYNLRRRGGGEMEREREGRERGRERERGGATLFITHIKLCIVLKYVCS